MPLMVGQVLYGCPLFGDHCILPYEELRVEAFGADWIIARDEQGRPCSAIGDGVVIQALLHTERPDEDR